MKSHLPAAKLKRDGRACTFNNSASRGFEHGFNTRPLNVPIDGVCEHLLESLALCSVHDEMIALEKFVQSLRLPEKVLIPISRYGSGRHHDLLQAGGVKQPHSGTAVALDPRGERIGERMYDKH